MPRFTVLAFAVAPLCLAVSCATTKPSVPLAPAATGEIPRTAYPAPTAEGLETLAGRSICLDPGHGGPWPGAVAPSNALRESDANLRVALRLTEILREAGATVSLTRVADNALIADSMSEDLSARARFANASGADVFLSIHHNADIVPNSGRDDLEMYYAMHDDGASRDLAEALTAAMARGFRSDAGRKLLLPGNYKVLRECTIPSVLLETGYMTHATTAARLAEPAGIDAEARSIAEGLAAYFALEPPRVREAAVELQADGRHVIDIAFADPAAIDAASVELRADDVIVAGVALPRPGGLAYYPAEPFPNGDVLLRLRARNQYGAAFTYRTNVAVDRPPAHIHVRQSPEAPAPTAAWVEWEAVVFDGNGRPVRDGLPVSMTPGGATSTTQNGRAYFYGPARSIEGPITFTAGAVTTIHTPGGGGQPHRSVRVCDAVTGEPITRAAAGEGSVSPGGWRALPPGRESITIHAPGYQSRSVDFADHLDVRLSPAAPALMHRRIVVDPVDGGRQPGAVGPDGARASDRAREAAEVLAALLRAAGAEVLVTRDGDNEIGEMSRVLAAERHKPELYVSITYGLDPNRARLMNEQGHQIDPMPPAYIAHYPGSASGRRLSQALGQALSTQRIVSSVYYPVQQVSCPAVLIQPAPIAAGAVTTADAMEHGARIFAGIQAYFASGPPR